MIQHLRALAILTSFIVAAPAGALPNVDPGSNQCNDPEEVAAWAERMRTEPPGSAIYRLGVLRAVLCDAIARDDIDLNTAFQAWEAYRQALVRDAPFSTESDQPF